MIGRYLGIDSLTQYRSYIICTSPRSGSTLLCRLLAATDRSGKPDSHFHAPSVSAWMGYYDISPDRYTDCRELLNAIFQAAIERGTGNTGIFGLRLQRHSFDFFMQKLRTLYANGSSDLDVDLIQEAFGKTLFIHLTRQNKLDQAISLVRATQTGLWHIAPGGIELERTAAPHDPVYDSDAIAYQLVELNKMEMHWNSWFAEQGLKPLRINYDDVSGNSPDVLARILHHLGLDPIVAHIGELPIAKMADATNRNWAERFRSEKGIGYESEY